MKKVIDPGNARPSINVTDDICYSHVIDKAGKPLDLHMFLMLQDGNSEMRLAHGRSDESGAVRQPVIVWLNGAGWHTCPSRLMSAEMEFLAESGYAVAFIEYRSSEKGVFPAQLQDAKTAVRFLRAHASQYGLDPQRIGAIGRSAGGHLASWLAMNTDGYDTDEWAEQSSNIQAAVDMFGPTDIPTCTRLNFEHIRTDPNYRWHSIKETHEGMLLGLTDDMTEEEIFAMGAKASPINYINSGMCPLTILHGDSDPLVPCAISEMLYDRLVEAGLGEQANLYIVKNGGHGTREFFQPMTKQLILEAFDRTLKTPK